MFQTFPQSGEGEVPIVYLPGIEGSGALCSQFLLKAESLYPITRLHYPGHSRLTLEEMADGCVAALGELGKTSAIWLGDSFGSAVALTIALRHPRATRGLVLASGMTKAPWASRLLFLARLWDAAPDKWRRSLLQRKLLKLSRKHPTRFYKSSIEEFMINGQLEFLSWRLRLLAAFNVRPRLAHIEAPVLYLGGEDDRVINTQEEARLIRQMVPRSRTFLFPGCGHAVLGERAVECLELIDLFVPLASRAAA